MPTARGHERPRALPYAAVMAHAAHVTVRPGVDVPLSELDLSATRSGGPGGQGVNTTSSRVRLRWSVRDSVALTDAQRALVTQRLAARLTDDGELVLTGSEHRSQHRNREAVMARFVTLVGEALTPPRVRRRTRPTRASQRRRLEAKRRRSQTKRLRDRPQA